MAKPLRFLDIEKSELRNSIRNVGADPDFIWFLLAWNGLIYSKEENFLKDRLDPSYLKRLKRNHKQDFEDRHLEEWEAVKKVHKEHRKLKLKRLLFSLQPLAHNKNGRPYNKALWDTAYDLRYYFESTTGNNQDNLIIDILFDSGNPDCKKDYTYVSSELSKRKHRYDPETEAQRKHNYFAAERFYEIKKDKVMETLKTGKPFYERLLNNEIILDSINHYG